MKGTFTEGMKHEQALDLIADALWRAGRDPNDHSNQPRPTQEHQEEAVLLLPLIISRLEAECAEGEREPIESQRITGRASNLLCRMIDEIAELRKVTIFEVMADYGLQIELMPKDKETRKQE
jgi:hypothetical protein